MGMWGASSGAEDKPKNLTDAEKDTCFATEGGWAVPAGGNGDPAAQPEVIAAIGNLAVALGAANLSRIVLANPEDAPFITTETMSFDISWNEKVVADWTSTAPFIIMNTPGGATTTIVASVVAGDKGVAKNTLRFTTTAILATHVAAAAALTLAGSDLIDDGDGSIEDANPDGSASGTASALTLALGGPDGATDLTAPFDASIATITVN